MRIAGLHAHHSNIDYIEQAFDGQHVELIHFVDPGLIKVIQSNSTMNIAAKVQEQLEWIAASSVDAIIVTCTNYIGYIENSTVAGIPIIKIDEPFFEVLQQHDHAYVYFTNPHTIESTMSRFQRFSKRTNIASDFHISTIEHTFDLIMANKKDAYTKAIVVYVLQQNPQGLIAFPQLSMVQAATELNVLGYNVITPVDALLECFSKKYSSCDTVVKRENG